MNAVLWVLTIVLALAFLAAGVVKLTQAKDSLRERMAWVDDFSAAQVKGIGAVEILGALGLVLPAVTGIAPVLVPLAATGLAIAMVLAVIVHLRRGDGFAVAVPAIVLGILAVIVAWGRFGPYSF